MCFSFVHECERWHACMCVRAHKHIRTHSQVWTRTHTHTQFAWDYSRGDAFHEQPFILSLSIYLRELLPDRWISWLCNDGRTLTSMSSPQAPALHPQLHPHAPLCVLHAEGHQHLREGRGALLGLRHGGHGEDHRGRPQVHHRGPARRQNTVCKFDLQRIRPGRYGWQISRYTSIIWIDIDSYWSFEWPKNTRNYHAGFRHFCLTLNMTFHCSLINTTMSIQRWKTLNHCKLVWNHVCVTNPAAGFGGPVSYRCILNMFYIDMDKNSITIP